MRKVNVKGKRELEQVLVEYIRGNEEVSIKYDEIYYKFHISQKGKKYVLSHAKEERTFNSIFDLANVVFEKCGLLPTVTTVVTERVKRTNNKPTNNK